MLNKDLQALLNGKSLADTLEDALFAVHRVKLAIQGMPEEQTKGFQQKDLVEMCGLVQDIVATSRAVFGELAKGLENVTKEDI